MIPLKAEDSRKAKAKKKNAKQTRATRRGVILISVLAVLILIVNIITASFSWFTPTTATGAGMAYEKKTYNRSEKCEFYTRSGLKQTVYEDGLYIDQMNYGDTNVDHVSVPGNGGRAYFRTSIENKDENYPSVVSLYFASVGTATSNLSFAVTYPSNTVVTVSGVKNDFCLMRNAFVKRKDVNDVDGPGLLQVDWFVINNGSSAVTLNLGPESTGTTYANMYLMYN